MIFNLLRGRRKDLSDAELIEKFKATNDPSYAGALFQRYSELISALALKYLKNMQDAEDAAMEVFEIMLRDLKEHEVRNFSPWIYSVTRFHCLKKKRKPVENSFEEASWPRISGDFVEFQEDEALMIKKEQERRFNKLEEEIEHLKDDQKECIKLFYLKDLSYKEISEKTGMSLKEVKSHIQNGKRNLKLQMERASEKS